MKKYSKQRSCPNCNKPVGVMRMLFRATAFSTWKCSGCDSELQVDYQRRVNIAGAVGMAGGLGAAFAMNDLWWAMLPLAGLLAWALSYDSVELKGHSQ